MGSAFVALGEGRADTNRDTNPSCLALGPDPASLQEPAQLGPECFETVDRDVAAGQLAHDLEGGCKLWDQPLALGLGRKPCLHGGRLESGVPAQGLLDLLQKVQPRELALPLARLVTEPGLGHRPDQLLRGAEG